MTRERRAFWADVRRDYAALWPEIRESWREMREEWRETTAEHRQYRQLTRRMWQRITGKPDPARRERRRAERAILAEADELEEIERRVLRERQDNRGPEATS